MVKWGKVQYAEKFVTGGLAMSEKKEFADRIREQTEPYDPFDRHEIIGGVRYELKPSPVLSHQMLVTRIWHSIESRCHPDGLAVTAPMDVHLDETNTVQPDVIFISNENMGIIQNGNIYGSPNLVVEILSPSTGLKDKTLKKTLYETFGIQEYWIVDGTYSTIDQLVLQGGKYALHATCGPEDTLTSPLLACVSLDVGKLFESMDRFT
jgi:Uma2 family endonuclease